MTSPVVGGATRRTGGVLACRDGLLCELGAIVRVRTAHWHPEARDLTRQIVTHATEGPIVHRLFMASGQSSSSVMSRFRRRGLATPKAQLSTFRLWLALRIGSQGYKQGEVAFALNYSSVQALGRVCRERLGCTLGEAFQRPEILDLHAVMQWDDPPWETAHVLTPSRCVA